VAEQLADRSTDILLDDIGRRCIDRNTARALFTESAEQQARERAQRAEHKVHMAEQGARYLASPSPMPRFETHSLHR
jgi:hypothetical protein